MGAAGRRDAGLRLGSAGGAGSTASRRETSGAAEGGATWRVVRDSWLGGLNGTRLVPKKCCSVRTIAPVAQRWPDGLSGNAGVTSGGAPGATAVEGSNKGSQAVSAVVAGLPS